TAAHLVLTPRLGAFAAAYPDIVLEIVIEDRFTDVVEGGFDAGVRLGESVEKDMIAVRIGPDWRLVAVGSPAYIAGRGVPKAPQDLIGHNCINLRMTSAGGLYAWEFQKAGQALRVRVDGQLVFNSTLPMVDAAIAGCGLAYVPEDLVTAHVAAGRLQLVLDDWSPKFAGYYLSYPSSRQNSPAFNVIVDALRKHSQ
ncbi:LysR substrate-binding domain-containing protein, partial [Mesorhizobium sp. B1-1-5]|uniref:LysR substrate-binding domain-containing protein n=1 Tax=Mesorhizobium sp. B1-1-5 TaxID=2589979 RepID=UPI001170B383